ncbi:MAG: hypothetical protein IKV21_03110, partial [Clostridia bacterium]|nr:hypothetical protein [Clostridia bacterium]
MDELTGEKNSADERIAHIQSSYEAADTKVKELTKAIEDKETEGEKLGKKRSELSEKREEITSKISKLNMDIHGADKDLSARTQALNFLKARLIDHEDRDKQL